MGEVLLPEATASAGGSRGTSARSTARGLVAAMHMVKPGGIEPDAALASAIVRRCVEKGLMMFAPVGYGGASVKMAPPLITPEEAIREGLSGLGGGH